MKKTFVIGVALAASVLTACGGDTDGTATPSSTPTSATSTSTSSTPSVSSPATEDSSSAAQPTESSEETTASDDASATGEPITLDEQSVTWFTTFCGSTTAIQEASSNVGSIQPDPAAAPAEQQATLATGVSDYGNVFKKAATDIAAVPPATIEGGQELADGATSAYGQVGDAMIAAAEKFAATPVTDQASLQAAATTLGTEVQASATTIQESLAPLESILTPELGAAVEKIPGCEEIAGS
ncbi:hypothetical protein [Nakamurella deserti]|uniref:hypothetical protein n=1 Tax=Nakamurella deserti TaxID=2164074 RepID=UPI0013009FCE|nr:hypothetical protein [Nakamurella deserti]